MKPLVTDELWDVVAPLMPRRRAQPRGGRPWVDDRATLNGVLYVLRTGIAARRQGVRLPPVPRRVRRPRREAPHRAPDGRAERPPGPPPLGGGAYDGVAGPLP